MAGCYGSDPEDKHWENKLVDHADDDKCENCGAHLENCACGYNEDF